MSKNKPGELAVPENRPDHPGAPAIDPIMHSPPPPPEVHAPRVAPKLEPAGIYKVIGGTVATAKGDFPMGELVELNEKDATRLLADRIVERV